MTDQTTTPDPRPMRKPGETPSPEEYRRFNALASDALKRFLADVGDAEGYVASEAVLALVARALSMYVFAHHGDVEATAKGVERVTSYAMNQWTQFHAGGGGHA